jgi:hypothetical protein
MTVYGLDGVGWKMSPTILATTLLVIADASSFWSANNPSFMTERRFTTNSPQTAAETKTDIRAGGAKAALESMLVGYGASIVTKSWWPLAIPLGYLAFNWAWHEWAMSHPHPTSTPMDNQG